MIPEVKEYCDDEVFKPSCGDNEAVVMQTARYGRMRTGKCVERHYEHMPCYDDVMGRLDMWCSGRQGCERDISDLNKQYGQRKPCPRDFRSYLEASYYCVPGTPYYRPPYIRYTSDLTML